MTLKEFETQLALGTVPEEYKLHPLRGRRPEKCVNKRTCHMCRSTINKGEPYHMIGNTYTSYLNVCNSCSYLSVVTILKMAETDEK